MLHFFDFECFSHDWLVVIINPFTEEKTVIVNDKAKLIDYYHKASKDVWVGYNSRNYDQWIMKAILCGFNPKEVSDWIVVKKRKGYEFSSLLQAFPLFNYDCMHKMYSLKQLEAFMGNDIRETTVPFDIDRKLTPAELDEVIKYCTHDVEQTIEVFLKTIDKYHSQVALLNTFKLPFNNIGKTQAQLSAIILGAIPVETNDEWDIRVPNNLKLGKYQYIADWFLNKRNHDSDVSLTTNVCGVEHIVAWGGLHGALSQYEYTCKEDEILLMADVDQLYPTIMIVYKLLSRAVREPERFSNILDTSLRLKHEKKKKERQPYKDVCNITYGAMGDKYNAMYDPLHRTLVCVYGQLFVIDLLEKLEPYITLVQSNTDGILVKIKEKDFDLIDDITYEWEQRTGLHMSFDLYERVIQKDVNNYIAVDFDDKYKSKGAYVKELNDLDNDLPIVNKAMKEYILHNVPVERTIYECNELKAFQKVFKVSNKYEHAVHNGNVLTDKTFRVFASTKQYDSFLGKVKIEDGKGKIEQFANSPTHCFIHNESVNGLTVPGHLNKAWYVDLAKKRLEQFGVGV